MSAVAADFNELLTHFIETDSVRFADFSRIWRQCNFSYIHSVCREGYVRVKFTSELLAIASQYLSSSYEFQTRIGGLYLLYSLYATQLCVPKVKTRLTQSMYEELLVFHATIMECKHYDADFILRILRNGKAFVFVAMPTTLCLHSGQLYSPRDEMQPEGIQANSVFATAVDMDHLQNLGKHHDEFIELKKQIASIDTGQPKGAVHLKKWRPSLEMTAENLIENLKETIWSYERRKRSRIETGLHNNNTVNKKISDWTHGQKEQSAYLDAVNRANIVTEAYSTIKNPIRSSRRSIREDRIRSKSNSDEPD